MDQEYTHTHRAVLLSFTWSVGVLHLGHLWSDELGGVLLLAAVRLLFLTLLHFFIVVLHTDTVISYEIIDY